MYSKTNFIGLEAIPYKLGSIHSNIDIVIRPFETSDLNSLNEGVRHSRLVEEQIPKCYVATTNENRTIYRQWLFTHKYQQQVIDYFGPIFPKISINEAIIEGVFTHPDYRGLRIMSDAMSKIIQQQQYKNIKRVIAFVEESNKASLKGFYRIGFLPYMIRKEVWFLFRRKVTLVQMSEKLQKKHLKAFL
ncbi:GNAT family N-acetyltransferase [Psychroserpens ponticola]|uniref:GNAT family N-acetyltransferase n=1 Tax=Psychroserpens ponticola TaxID=2932268 RepID=A0ABY7S342_9FLAO|nr:GNAT family N-acetyltransferase [Psychroserpens ponticola]WCO03306.1 GNAT family N-acetyltransferase [Psychroserpens ponticola]